MKAMRWSSRRLKTGEPDPFNPGDRAPNAKESRIRPQPKPKDKKKAKAKAKRKK